MRKAMIIILLFATLLIAGCTQLPGLPKKSGPSIIATTQSITVEAKNPRSDEAVSGNHEFTPIIEAFDSGDADSEGVLCISGLSEDTFRGFTGCECQDFNIYADEKDGETSQEMEFGPYSITAEEQKEELMTIATRYTYETKAQAKACMKKDVYSKTGCQLTNIANQKRDIMTGSTSGAIKVTKITENIIPIDERLVTLSFNIEVEKASTGDIYDYNKASYPTCRAEEKQSKIITGELSGLPQGNIGCTEAELNEKGTGTLVCEAENLRLFDSKGNFLFPGDSYEPDIEIKLKYGYEQISTIKFNVAPKTR